MRNILSIFCLLALLPFATLRAEEAVDTTKPAEKIKRPEEIDISDLEQDYWRPNLDELEVVQNRRYQKKGRFEVGLHHGIYQGLDYVNSTSNGISVTYNLSNEFFVEGSYSSISNVDNDFLNSLRNQFGFTPDFNRQTSQTSLSAGWTPIYAKFSLLGQKISHFETYIAPGIGLTQTAASHITGHLTIGEKFYLTEHLLFRIDWKMSRFTDTVNTTQGRSAVKNGGPGYVEDTKTTHDIIFGIGWMF